MTFKPSLSRTTKCEKEKLVVPDGGWGWIVVIASGLGSLLAIAAVQQFGIIFRDRLNLLGMNATQMTTIINVHTAVSACSGLFNGPMFRKLSCRQVGIIGSVLTFVGLFFTIFTDSFLCFIINFAIIYGLGRGLVISSSTLAINIYFKEKRRIAVSFQLAVASLCSIFLPHLATYLVDQYGTQGTVLIFSGISLHSLACALTYQPVEWHMKKIDSSTKALNEEAFLAKDEENENEYIDCGIITDPETPMFSRANDGWYGSKASISAQGRLSRRKSSLIIKDDKSLHRIMGSTEIPLSNTTDKLPENIPEDLSKLPFYTKVAIFFDLDLLRDLTYLNLVIGLMIINFTEINFVVLSPLILSDFGYNSADIAKLMSLFALCDFIVRIVIPFTTQKLSFGNKTLFIFGVMGMCLGRTVAAHTTNFVVLMICFGWMGISRAFRLVFSLLIIPSYVSIERLPAAAGLQLLLSGIFTLIFGPLIGVVRSATDYIVTIHFLNIFCYVATIMWIAEHFYQRHRSKRNAVAEKK